MLLGVVSDSHGQVRHTMAAVRMLESLAVEAVIHCGDIGSPEIVELFAPWPTHFVFGNVDDRQQLLREAIARAGLVCHERFGDLTLAGRRIAFLHGDDWPLLESTVESGDFDLVCYGHTHVAKLEALGRTLLLNPGALYRANPHTLATVELEAMQVDIVAL